MDNCSVIAKTNKFTMTVAELLEMLSVSLDKKSFTFFELNGTDPDPEFDFEQLLQLEAGNSTYELSAQWHT